MTEGRLTLRDIQAGRGGFGSSLARAGLSILSGGWALAQVLKRGAYGVGLRRRVSLAVPVISVGNVTVGGTGKTPFVAWVVARLREDGRRPGILARGYGPTVIPDGQPGGPLDDEGAVLRALLGDRVPQVQTPDRVRGGRALLAASPTTDVLVLDDGFQHWRLVRDLDVVLVDATCPFGYGHYLPRGRLREAPAALARAGAVVITRADQAGADSLAEIERRIRSHTAAPIARASLRPAMTFDGEAVFAACAIGNPDAFLTTLEAAGARVVGHRFFDDHADFGSALDAIRAAARHAGATRVVVTRKDAVKLGDLGADVVALDVTLELTAGEAGLREVIRAAVGARG